MDGIEQDRLRTVLMIRDLPDDESQEFYLGLLRGLEVWNAAQGKDTRVAVRAACRQVRAVMMFADRATNAQVAERLDVSILTIAGDRDVLRRVLDPLIALPRRYS